MRRRSFTLEELANLTDSQLIGNPKHSISGVADLDSAGPSDASFFANPKYEQAMKHSAAGVIFITSAIPSAGQRNFLITADPSLAFQKTLEALRSSQEHSGFTGIHPSAVIHESAQIGQEVTIGPHAVIDQHAKVGDHTFIGAGCYIGPSCIIGQNCLVHPNVTIREGCHIGNRVILQPGVVIGSCGFGFITDKKGCHQKLNQLGNVIIEDDVEIGANTTIDRARFQSTKIGSGTKIDNLVQIAHGVIVGENNLIVAQAGIAGSTTLGKNVILAGQSAVGGHLKLADGVVVTARGGVSKSLTKGGKYSGVPAIPYAEYQRTSVLLRNLGKYVEQIKELQKHLETLERKNE